MDAFIVKDRGAIGLVIVGSKVLPPPESEEKGRKEDFCVKRKKEKREERKKKEEKERNAHLPDFFKVGAYVAHRRCRHCCVTFAKGLWTLQTCSVLRGKRKRKKFAKTKGTFKIQYDYWLLVCMHCSITISLSHSLSLTL